MTKDQIDSIRVMRLHPGDTLVINVQRVLKREQRDQMLRTVQQLIPEGVKCMVLDGGVDLEVLRSTDAACTA